MDATQTRQLIVLLHAQQREARLRSGEIRYSGGWFKSSARLDRLNEEIMHLGGLGPIRARGPNRGAVDDAPD